MLKLRTKDYDDALRYVNEALAIRRSKLRPEHPDLATTLHTAGIIRLARKDAAGARAYLLEADELRSQLYTLTDRRRIETTLALADCEAQCDRWEAAHALVRQRLRALATAGYGRSSAADELQAFLDHHTPPGAPDD